MEELPVDVLRKTALNLSPRDIISLCLTKSKFNEQVCNSKYFWRNKILLDYSRQTYDPTLYKENPKRLYMILSMDSKVIEIPVRGFEQLTRLAYEPDNIHLVTTMANEITKYITPKFIYKSNLRRGDVLHLSWRSKFRNDGNFMWDGEKAVVLHYDPMYEYGMVPKEFRFPEFRPNYFLRSITYQNDIIWIDSSKTQEINENFNIETQTSSITDKYGKYEVSLLYSENFINLNDMVEIKFSKVFFDKDYLLHPFEQKLYFFTDIELFATYNIDGAEYKLRFNKKWKDSIISVTPKPGSTYEWIEDDLYIFR